MENVDDTVNVKRTDCQTHKGKADEALTETENLQKQSSPPRTSSKFQFSLFF